MGIDGARPAIDEYSLPYGFFFLYFTFDAQPLISGAHFQADSIVEATTQRKLILCIKTLWPRKFRRSLFSSKKKKRDLYLRAAEEEEEEEEGNKQKKNN